MAAFAFFFLTPTLAYCVVQTVRDLRRRSWLMAAIGGVFVALLLFAHFDTFERLPGSR